MVERTFVMLKHDAVARGIMGEVISRFERVGLAFVGMKMVWIDADFAKTHYEEHVGKPFYPGLEKMIVEGPLLAMVLEGVSAVEVVRKMVGATEPKAAAPGTIRGDYSHMDYAHADTIGGTLKNIIHASANTDDAKREIALWFNDKEMHSYRNVHTTHTQ